MRKILKALINLIAHIFTHHKVFLGLLFLLTAGQEFPLPEWLDITLGLIMTFSVVIWFLH